MTIAITQREINRGGERLFTQAGPMYRALKRFFPRQRIWVFTTRLIVMVKAHRDWNKARWAEIKLPAIARRFNRGFDAGHAMRPITFQLQP